MVSLAWVILFCITPAIFSDSSTSSHNCPTFLYYNTTSKTCECGDSPCITCYQESGEAYLVYSFCATYSKQENVVFSGRCPYNYFFNQTNYWWSRLPSDPDMLNHVMCGPYNRKGLLCGDCTDGYGPALYSLDRKCVDCSKFSTGVAVCLFLLIECVPVLLFFFCVTLFRINFTSGPMLGYVIFCQVISYGIESLPAQAYNMINSTSSLILILIEFWNMNFVKSFIPPFCISDKLTGLQVIFLNSITTVYPLLIVIASLFLIHLHSSGNRVIVVLYKPLTVFHKLTKTKEITSDGLIHTFASFLFLSSTKTFFLFLTVAEHVPVFYTNGSIYKEVLYADSSVEYFSREYFTFLSLALTQCLFFVFIPSLLLFIYPTRVYRWMTRFISARKRLAITAFVEALNHCFKDGLDGTTDCRALAGFCIVGVPVCCLVFRVLFYAQKKFTYLFIFLAGPSLSLLVSYSQPFKSTVANISVSFFLFVSLIVILAFNFWTITDTSLENLSTFIFIFFQVPCFAWVLYNFVRYIRKKRRFPIVRLG